MSIQRLYTILFGGIFAIGGLRFLKFSLLKVKAIYILKALFINSEIEQKFELFQMLIDEIRSVRANSNIAANQKIPLTISCKNTEQSEFFNSQSKNIQYLAKSSELLIGL